MTTHTMLGIDTSSLRSSERLALATNFTVRPETVTKFAVRYLVTYLAECEKAVKAAHLTAAAAEPADVAIATEDAVSRVLFDIRSLTFGSREVAQLLIDVLEAGIPAAKNAWIKTLYRVMLKSELTTYTRSLVKSGRNLFPENPEVKECGIYAYNFDAGMGCTYKRFVAWVEFRNGERFAVRLAPSPSFKGKDTGWATRACAYIRLDQFIRFRLNRDLPTLRENPVSSIKTLADDVRVVFLKN